MITRARPKTRCPCCSGRCTPVYEVRETPLAEAKVSIVRGYTVRVLQKKTTLEDALARRKIIAEILARSLRKSPSLDH